MTWIVNNPKKRPFYDNQSLNGMKHTKLNRQCYVCLWKAAEFKYWFNTWSSFANSCWPWLICYREEFGLNMKSQPHPEKAAARQDFTCRHLSWVCLFYYDKTPLEGSFWSWCSSNPPLLHSHSSSILKHFACAHTSFLTNKASLYFS